MQQLTHRKFRIGVVYLLNLMFVAGVSFISLSWNNADVNPLLNTHWKGIMNVPDALECGLTFKQDSAIVYLDVTPIETMHYRVSGDTVFLKKIEGASPCVSETGAYRYQIKNDVLTLSLIKDDCSGRAQAFTPEGYKKQ